MASKTGSKRIFGDCTKKFPGIQVIFHNEFDKNFLSNM